MASTRRSDTRAESARAPDATARLHIELYDADGWDRSITLDEIDVGNLQEQQLLWVDVGGQDPELIAQLAERMRLPAELIELLQKPGSTPQLKNYGNCFCIRAVSVRHPSRLSFHGSVIALVVGTNYVVSVHPDEVPFLEELRERERGETDIGVLDAESFAASLLDWHLSTYFDAVSALEGAVERMEVAILAGSGVQPLQELQRLRRGASRLRHMLAAHRTVFAAMARPDFRPRQERAAHHFITLQDHYERAIDRVEGARDLVIGSFELFASHTAWRTNEVVRALTFFTVLLGVLAVLAGVFGMNFEAPFFRTEARGFWSVVIAMAVVGVLALLVAKWRDWL